MIFPSVLFSTVVNGAYLTWLVISSLVSYQVLAYPPYNLKPDMLAYVGLPSSISGFIGSVAAGVFSDWLIKYMTKRNKGVYEPEYRLLLMIVAVVMGTAGFVGLGFAYRDQWSVPRIIALAQLFYLSMPFASSACITYIFDTQGSSTTLEAFVATSLFKSLFIFFATTYVPKWYARVGPMYCFTVLSILNVAFCSLTIPMYIFGKRLRGYVARSEKLMKMARVQAPAGNLQ